MNPEPWVACPVRCPGRPAENRVTDRAELPMDSPATARRVIVAPGQADLGCRALRGQVVVREAWPVPPARVLLPVVQVAARRKELVNQGPSRVAVPWRSTAHLPYRVQRGQAAVRATPPAGPVVRPAMQHPGRWVEPLEARVVRETLWVAASR